MSEIFDREAFAAQMQEMDRLNGDKSNLIPVGISPGEAPVSQFAKRQDEDQSFLDRIDATMQNGSTMECTEILNEARKLYPNSRYIAYKLTKAFTVRGEYLTAISEAERLTAFDPTNPWFIAEVGYANFLAGNMTKAIESFQKAYELGCRDMEMMANFTDAWIQTNRSPDQMLERLHEVMGDQYAGCASFSVLDKYLYRNMVMLCRNASNHSLQLWVVLSLCNYIRNNMNILYHHKHWASYLLIGAEMLTIEDGVLNEVIDIINDLAERIPDTKTRKDIEQLRNLLILGFMKHDERLFDGIREIYDGVNLDSDFNRYVAIDGIMCCIANKESTIESAEILRKEYPFAYRQIEPTLEVVFRTGPEDPIARKLQSELYILTMYGGLSGGHYIDSLQRGTEFELDLDGLNYNSVKMTPCVGRIDPCPC